MHGFHKTRRRHRRQSVPSSKIFDALRAFDGARLLLRGRIKSIAVASARAGSSIDLVQAAAALCAGDPSLRARVVRGGFPVSELPRQVRRISTFSAPVVTVRAA